MVLIQNKKIKYFALVALLTTACVFTYYKVKHIHTIESFEMPSAIRNNISDFAWDILPAFEKIEFNDPVYLVEEPGTRRLFVIEREGRIFSFNKDMPNKKTLVLDISKRTFGRKDTGMLGLALHPEYGVKSSPNRGYLYVSYSFGIPKKAPWFTKTIARISRFTIPDKSLTVDIESELVLIDQEDEHLAHFGGAMFFHPDDGFLYISLGDEGVAVPKNKNCQVINTDLFSGIIRIDVDKQGGKISHPIMNQPKTGRTNHYYIPNDNPFVGIEGVLEEFYALGLRSPHSMTYDPNDKLAWIADVGLKSREELNILAKGANYQWCFNEGKVHRTPPPEKLIGISMDPVFDYGRDKGGSIIGGRVYRGKHHKELYGKYIYGDWGAGTIWALSYNLKPNGLKVTDNRILLKNNLRGYSSGLTSISSDLDNEIYLLYMGKKRKLQRLVKSVSSKSLPQRLSETKLFSDLKNMIPNNKFHRYEINLPSWSDGVNKSYWIYIPKGYKIDFVDNGTWRLPASTILIENFSILLNDKDLSSQKRLEVRILVIGEGDNFYGAAYRWNDDLSDAILVSKGNEFVNILLQRNGKKKNLKWAFTDPLSCMSCHTGGNKKVLGIKTHQLNRPVKDSYFFGLAKSNKQINQLKRWTQLGFLDKNFFKAQKLNQLAKLVSLDDKNTSLTLKVRSYLDSNCSYCHYDKKVFPYFDARITTALKNQGIVNQIPRTKFGNTEFKIIAPGSIKNSLLHYRVSSKKEIRMPPVGQTTRDKKFLKVLSKWILSDELRNFD